MTLTTAEFLIGGGGLLLAAVIAAARYRRPAPPDAMPGLDMPEGIPWGPGAGRCPTCIATRDLLRRLDLNWCPSCGAHRQEHRRATEIPA